MKLTKEQLKQIIKEELAGLSEALPYDDPLVGVSRIVDAADALSRLSGLLEKDAKEPKLSNEDRDILLLIKLWLKFQTPGEEKAAETSPDDPEKEEFKFPDPKRFDDLRRRATEKWAAGKLDVPGSKGLDENKNNKTKELKQ
jgi:hypothetical protein